MGEASAITQHCSHKVGIFAVAEGWHEISRQLAEPLLSIALYICWLLGQRQRRTDRRLAANAHLEPETRLAMDDLDFHVRLRRQRLITEPSYHLPLTQTQTGDYLGLSAVHVDRILRSFHDEHVANVERNWVTILDIERLKRLARG